MAVTPRDIPVTREQVYAWINEYNAAAKGNKRVKKLARDTVAAGGTIENYVEAKVEALNLDDPYVNTSGHDALGEITPLDKFICMDLSSYPNYNGPGS